MRAWIQSSLFGVPLPERILPSLSRTKSVLALARPGLRRVGMKKVSVPGMRALACPKALERPKRSTMRLASATSRLSVGCAPRRLAQPVAVERAEPPRAHAMQREKRKSRDAQEVFLGLGPRRIVRPARPAGDDAALQPVHSAVHCGGDPFPLPAVGLKRRLRVQGEDGGRRPVARGELLLLSAPEQGPPPVRTLGRKEELELALVSRNPVLRESPQHPRRDAEVIRMLALGKPAPAGAFGSSHGAEILLDPFDVDPARVVRIVFPERDENPGGGPGLAGELSFPVEAAVERPGKLFRFLADGAARFVRRRRDPVPRESNAPVAAGRFGRKRG